MKDSDWIDGLIREGNYTNNYSSNFVLFGIISVVAFIVVMLL